MAIKNNKHRKGGDKQRKPDVAAKLNALPNTFKFAAESLKIMSERGGSAGSIVVNKYKSYNYKLIYALVMNTIKNIKIIKKIIHEVKLSKKVPENDPFLLEILVGDLLFGKGLKSVEQNSTAVAILAQKESIVKQQNLLKKEYASSNDQASVKYLRINHMKSNFAHILSQLKTIGLQQVEYSKDKIKFKKFINKFRALEANQFLLDFHFPNDLIVLKPEAADKLKKTDLLKKGKAMLQDKASYLAIEALDVKPNQKIIDACCAPGCKTALIGNKLKNKGKILAFDIDKKRLISAIRMLKIHGVTCAKTEVIDFSKVKLNRLLKTHNIDSFDSILIDPSCSGSGIKSRVDYKATHEEIGRLKKLQAFQVSLLKHALKSSASKSIVYCTCSTSVEENEQVIEMALNESGAKSNWDIVELIPYWTQRGDANYEFGTKCVRSDENSLTNGFFIAKLVRNDKPMKVTNEEEGQEENNVKKVQEEVEMDENEIESSDYSDAMAPEDEEENEEEDEEEEEEDEDEEDEDEEEENDSD